MYSTRLVPLYCQTRSRVIGLQTKLQACLNIHVHTVHESCLITECCLYEMFFKYTHIHSRIHTTFNLRGHVSTTMLDLMVSEYLKTIVGVISDKTLPIIAYGLWLLASGHETVPAHPLLCQRMSKSFLLE